MVNLKGLMMILELHQQGLSVPAIAARTGLDRKTVRKVIAREGSASRGRLPQPFQHPMVALAASGRLDEACQALVEGLPAWRRNGVFATSAALAPAESGAAADAARVGVAAIAYLKRADIECHPSLQHMNDRWQALLAAPCEPADLARWQLEGEALDEAAIEAICLGDVQNHPASERTR